MNTDDRRPSGEYHERKRDFTPVTSGYMRGLLAESDDICFRDVHINGNSAFAVTLAYVDGMVNTKLVDDDVLKPLLQEQLTGLGASHSDIIERILAGGIYHNAVKAVATAEECAAEILFGSAALIFDGAQKAVVFDAKGFDKRSISEPTDENVIKGAKDGFIESLRSNTAIIRTRVKNKNLRVKQDVIGRQTSTGVAVVYIEGIANPEIVQNIRKKLADIDIDGAVSAGAVEEYIIDRRFSVFPQVEYTERPDKLCANLLDGRIGLLIDGIPFAYILPASFALFMRAPEDYSFNYVITSIFRIIRYAAFIIALIVPAYYIAVVTFHHEMIPTELTISIINSKNGVPFPTFVETLFMLVAFELLVQAGLRMPKTIGQAASIVGAIVVGQAAVSAKFLSSAVIVVISVAGIAGFCLPNQDFSNSVRSLRMFLVLCASFAGLFGLAAGLMAVCIHMASLKPFGIPFLRPFIGTDPHNIYDNTVIRAPMPEQKMRPSVIAPFNKRKQR